jgi:hypothetical protein
MMLNQSQSPSPPSKPSLCQWNHHPAPWLGTVFCLLSPMALVAGQTLFTFDAGFDLKRIECTDAKISFPNTGKGLLRIETGREQRWPGIRLPASAGHWDLSPYAHLVLDITNTGTNFVTVFCRVDNLGADGTKNCLTESLRLQPGRTGTLRVNLRREAGSQLGGKLFGMRGYPVASSGSGTLDVKNVTQLLLFVREPKENHCFEVANIRAAGEYVRPTAWVTDADPFLPFIDTFGQYKHKDWPGKVHSLDELRQRRGREAADLTANPGPLDWDQYGGWAKGPQLQATGFFRTEHVKGKWWLVDPDGHLFWSHGIDCVRMLDSTPVEERSTWFEDFPGDDQPYGEFLSTGYALKGHYAGRNPKTFSFAGANLKRKYGENWKQDYAATVHRRLRSWGLNTIANWSDAGIFLQRHTPYTDTLGSHGAHMIEGSEGYWGKFPDVFDTTFASAVRRAMEAKQRSTANDPWCIGYFSDNEMSWGDDTSLALGALKSLAGQAAKKEFVSDLRKKYLNVDKLNSAWGTTHASWEGLLESRELPDQKRAREDLVAFDVKTAETYFRIVRAAIKAVAPNQLYLGCRFAGVNDHAAKAAGKYCDVVSYNFYLRTIADFQYPGGDKPLIVGEFHFGALDRGLFHTGLVPMENQRARAEAYREYVLGALRHPQFVGTHWFQWQDEPTTGRIYDEENYQIGFVDIADTPYPETVNASREVGRRLYDDGNGIRPRPKDPHY